MWALVGTALANKSGVMSNAFPRIQAAAFIALVLIPLNYVRGVVTPNDTPELKTELELIESANQSLLAATHALQSTRGLLEVLAPASEETVSLMLYAPNFRQYETFDLTMDGKLVNRTERDLRQFFRCRRSGRRHRMNPRVLAMLADLGKKYEGRVIEIVSGYRRRGFGAPRSKHFVGNAIDLRIRGVENTEIRDYLWGKYESLGLGHYHKQNFLHMDFRPARAKIGWLQKRPTAQNRYNPWWTKEGVEDPAIKLRARRARRLERRARKRTRRKQQITKHQSSHDYYSLMQD